MRKQLDFWYEAPQGYFSLIWPDYGGGGMGHEDMTYHFVLHVLRSYRTGEICGFSNDGGELATDYPRIVELLRQHPIAERFDVPALGLYDATIDRIIAEIYERYVVRGETFVPPPWDESQLPAWVREAEARIRREMEKRPARAGLYERRERAVAGAVTAVREEQAGYETESSNPDETR